MTSERDILEGATSKLGRAIERGTGTSLDAEEVAVLGRVLHAMGSVALGSAQGREACAVCGQPSHPEQAIGQYAPHEYQPALLVPMLTPAEE